MTLPETIPADYTLRLRELAAVLAALVKAHQPTLVWGPPPIPSCQGTFLLSK